MAIKVELETGANIPPPGHSLERPFPGGCNLNDSLNVMRALTPEVESVEFHIFALFIQAMRQPALHIIMVILVFASASGLLVNVHYCQQERKGATLFVSGASCHAAESGPMDVCPMHAAGAPTSEKDCCDDEARFFKLEQQQSFQIPLLNDLPLADVPLFLPRLLAGRSQDFRTLHFHNHKPPLLRGDPQPELQVFRC